MPRPPRSELFVPSKVCIMHSVQRCVRRAFLAGEDPVSGKDFEPRREGYLKLLDWPVVRAVATSGGKFRLISADFDPIGDRCGAISSGTSSGILVVRQAVRAACDPTLSVEVADGRGVSDLPRCVLPRDSLPRPNATRDVQEVKHGPTDSSRTDTSLGKIVGFGIVGS